MKTVFFSGIFLIFVSCFFLLPITSCKTSVQKIVEPIVSATIDTFYIYVPIADSEKIKTLEDSIKVLNSNNRGETIKLKDYINARRAEKIKYYISICDKNSKNKKFFFGWIKRTMSEKY